MYGLPSTWCLSGGHHATLIVVPVTEVTAVRTRHPLTSSPSLLRVFANARLRAAPVCERSRWQRCPPRAARAGRRRRDVERERERVAEFVQVVEREPVHERQHVWICARVPDALRKSLRFGFAFVERVGARCAEQHGVRPRSADAGRVDISGAIAVALCARVAVACWRRSFGPRLMYDAEAARPCSRSGYTARRGPHF